MKLRTTSVADQDVAAAAEWFERQRLGLGDDFLTDAELVFAEIRRAPRGCPTLQFAGLEFKVELRWTHVGRFAYVVVY
jgi:hypothetical protein